MFLVGLCGHKKHKSKLIKYTLYRTKQMVPQVVGWGGEKVTQWWPSKVGKRKGNLNFKISRNREREDQEREGLR